MEPSPKIPMPLVTKTFGAVMKVLAKPPTNADEMVALRTKRERLVASAPGRLVSGTDHADVAITNIDVALGGHATRVRVQTPPNVTAGAPVILYFHGGGWCIGSPEQSRWLTSRLAIELGAIVVSPAYRLAPEHPFPAAVDDAQAALDWVRSHATELGGSAQRIAVAGDSAGANLAAVTALHALGADASPLTAQVLIYPAVDADSDWPSHAENANAPILTANLMDTFATLYLGEGPVDDDWRHSPIHAQSHADLPPALIITAGHDPLRDHGTEYAKTLTDAGVPTQLLDYPDTIHGFMSLPGIAPASRPALDAIVAFLRKKL